MKRLVLPLLAALAIPAQAGFETAANPFSPSPLAMPMAGLINPLGGNPLLAGVPLAGLGGLGMLGWNGMYPMLQMAPNMMSYSHLNQMANPYLGGPFAGNPYLRQSLPIPLMPPAFSPSMPSLPFAPVQGMVPFTLPQQAVPMAAPGFFPQGFFPLAPGMVQQPMYPAPQAAYPPLFVSAPPAAPQPAQVGNPYLPGAAPQPQAAPANTPLDPAAFMQMYMQPTQPAGK